MKPILPIFIMVDACGWEIIRNDPFCEKLAPTRRKLDSVFGYSSTCVPSILSGRWPDEHRNWCYFVHDPKNSPFRPLRWLQWLPKAITSRRIARRMLTKVVKKKLGFQGYFDLYNVPFKHIASYDFTEKKSPLQPGGMNRGGNIFDFLEKEDVPYFVSNPDVTEEENREALKERIAREEIEFAFCYWPGLDGLLHRVGNDSPQIPERLRVYEEWLDQVMATAREHYQEVRLFVFSDHGMANCDEHLDLMRVIEALPLKMGTDYSVVYDSTMARFWFHTPGTRALIEAALAGVKQGRIMPDGELKELRTLFDDRAFGELIFLVQEGVLIVPSHMGERPIRAMHGYHPKDKHSYASLLTNQPSVPENITAIPHIFRLMTQHALAAKAARTPTASSECLSLPPVAEQSKRPRKITTGTSGGSIIHVPRRFVSEEWGGTETVILETCRKQQAAGGQPVIYTSMALASKGQDVVDGVPVHRYDYCHPFFGLSETDKQALDKKGGNLLSLPLFSALVKARGVRLFHAHTLKRVGGAVRTAARLRKKPFVVTLHGGVFDVPAAESASLVKPIEGKWEWGKPFGALFGSRRVLEDADMVLCVGRSEYEKACRELPHDRVAYMPNGVSCSKFAKGDGAAFREQHHIPQDACVVLNISRIDEQKNQLLLLQAFAQMARQHRTAHLVLIGPETMPAYAARLREFIASEKLGDRVHMLPGMKNTDPSLVDAYHACDMFVLPSAHEPFGIVVLEAWSAGKPVVASNVGGLSALVTADRNGLVIAPDAADDLTAKMLRLAHDPELRRRLAEAGHAEATQKYDWSHIAVLQEDLYQQAEASAAARYGRRKS